MGLSPRSLGAAPVGAGWIGGIAGFEKPGLGIPGSFLLILGGQK